jgi:aldehyde:ferredoxin oxidoreductase
MDADDLWQVARRNRNLVRAINISRGLKRTDEKPPADHWKVREPEKEAELLDAYYRFKGWTRDGVPTKPTLEKLGLGDVAEALVNRGILTGDETEVYTDQSCYSEKQKKEAVLAVRQAEKFTLTEYISKNK